MNRRALRLSLLLLPGALLAACGGGNDATDSTAAAPNATLTAATLVQSSPAPAVPVPVPNDEGASLTFSAAGGIDNANPFFKPMGNGRSCASCHQPDNGWSINPAGLAARFNSSGGLDPVFRPVDGAVSPLAPTATLEQKKLAYSMLLAKGLIRVGLPMPANAEFSLIKADDPYNYASAKELSLFRRPLPSTNLKFIASVMWDGRETIVDAASHICLKDAQPARCFAPVDTDLLHQANSAVRGHAEAAQDLTAAEQRAIVDFEKSLFTAQVSSTVAGSLTEAGALGGPLQLSKEAFYFGINEPRAGDYLSGALFNRNAMNLFGAWRNLAAPPPPQPQQQVQRGRPAPPPPPPAAPSTQNLARAAIARGEQIFNNKPFIIAGVNGLNDELHLAQQRGSCTTCHNTPNVGTHSVARLFNTGSAAANLRTPDLPLYSLRNNATGEVIDTSDPGSAMQSGKWSDIGKVKVPSLRGLESRSPYFHNGSQRSIEDVVRFYDRRFRIGLTAQEAADLAAFLKAL